MPHFRSLGVNFSKIQSLTLDKMGTASLLIARKMGNELFNEVINESYKTYESYLG